MEGPDLDLLGQVAARTEVPLIASGGIGSLSDLIDLRDLDTTTIEGVIVGKALYEGRFTLAEATRALSAGSVE